MSASEKNIKSTYISNTICDGKDDSVNLITALAKRVLMPLFNTIN